MVKRHFLMAAVMAAVMTAFLGATCIAPAMAEMEIPSRKQKNPAKEDTGTPPQAAPGQSKPKAATSPKDSPGSWRCRCENFSDNFDCSVVCIGGAKKKEVIPNHNCHGKRPTAADLHCAMDGAAH